MSLADVASPPRGRRHKHSDIHTRGANGWWAIQWRAISSRRQIHLRAKLFRYGDEIGRLLLTGPGYSAYVLTFRCRRDQSVRMVTATDVTFLTVAIYLLDLAIKVVALGLVPEGRRPSSQLVV